MKYIDQVQSGVLFCIDGLHYHHKRIRFYTQIHKFIRPSFMLESTILEGIYIKLYGLFISKYRKKISKQIKHEMTAYINRVGQICEHIKNKEKINNKNNFSKKHEMLGKYQLVRHNYTAHRALDRGSEFNGDFWLDLGLSGVSGSINNKGEIILKYRDKDKQIEGGKRFDLNILEDHKKILTEIKPYTSHT